jgi:8-oxo-dGTP pyrophosphatase MutT (NUDIX family)
MKPLKTEVAFATPWFQVLGKTMREAEEPYYSLKLPDYAAVVALTEEQRVVIVRQYRPAVEHHTLELPSGLVDAGETPLEAARRELLEETGYEGGDWAVHGGMEPDVGRLGNRIWTCVAKGVRPAPNSRPEAGIEVLTWSLDELRQAMVDCHFDHALHVAVVMIAVLKGGVTFSLPQPKKDPSQQSELASPAPDRLESKK